MQVLFYFFFVPAFALGSIYFLMATGMKTMKIGVMRLMEREKTGGIFLLAGVTILVVGLFLLWHFLKFFEAFLERQAGY